MRRFLGIASILSVALILLPAGLHSGPPREIHLPPVPNLGSATFSVTVSNVGNGSLDWGGYFCARDGSRFVILPKETPLGPGESTTVTIFRDASQFPMRFVISAPRIGDIRATQCIKADTQWTCVSWP